MGKAMTYTTPALTVTLTELERFASKIKIVNGCWEWSMLHPKGYGQLTLRYKTQRAHRLMYELIKGAIPAGLQLDHLCRNRCCVNPEHLEPVTSHENTLRSPYVGLATCYRGHKKTVVASGYIYCRECHKEANRKSRVTQSHLKRNNAISFCGLDTESGQEFVEIIEDATCKSCIRFMKVGKK